MPISERLPRFDGDESLEGSNPLRRVKRKYHHVRKQLADAGTPEGERVGLAACLRELRDQHERLSGQIPNDPEVQRYASLIRQFRAEYDRTDAKLGTDIARLEEKDPALGASLRRVQNAW